MVNYVLLLIWFGCMGVEPDVRVTLPDFGTCERVQRVLAFPGEAYYTAECRDPNWEGTQLRQCGVWGNAGKFYTMAWNEGE